MTRASYRFAAKASAPVILDLVMQLAEQEKSTDQVVATEKFLHESRFVRHTAELLLTEADG